MIDKIKNNWPVIFLVIITLVLVWRNYTPGTWLSGWDTLHPEFNFGLNFQRLIFGVFRPEQGLGTIASHAHMADLPRVAILYFFSFFLPLDTLRYLYLFLTLLAGPLGIYFFLKETRLTKIAAFLGGLFYLLNLATLQHFYVPFEMFTTQYAALPWLFLTAIKYLCSGSKKSLLLFALTTLLATPMAYAATLWYAYFLAFSLFLFFFGLPKLIKKDFSDLKRSILLVIVTLLINSYWVLPQLYFLKNHASEIPQAKINQLFSEEAYLANKEFGTIKDTALLKSFLFNWSHYDYQKQNFTYLLQPWRTHLQNPWVLGIGYLSFALVLWGLAGSFWQRERYGLALFLIFLLSLIFLSNAHLESFFAWLRESSPLLKEALRFPYTKFSLLFLFTATFYFARAQDVIFRQGQRSFRQAHLLASLQVIVFASSLIYYFLPAFQGYLIDPQLKIKIPQRYFEMFAWFNQQPQGRIANLPVHSFWGWEYYDWATPEGGQGFQGAGFLWFGIKQPILARDFDRWNPANEQYFREISYAVYSRNLSLFEKVLEKYQIRYLLFDRSVISPEKDVPPRVLYFDEIEKLLAASPKIKLAKSFSPQLKIYGVDLADGSNLLSSPANFVRVEPKYALLPGWDQAYWERGTYISGPDKDIANFTPESFYFPARNFWDKGERLSKVLKIENGSFTLDLGEISGKSLILPDYSELNMFIEASIFAKRQSPAIFLKIVPHFPKILPFQPPPIFTFEIPRFAEGLLAFNQKEVFSLSQIETQESYLGEVILKTQEENKISVYSPSPSKVFSFPQEQEFLPENCGSEDQAQNFGVTPQPESFGFTLFAQNTLACLTLPLSSFGSFGTNVFKDQREILASLTFDFQAENGEKPQLAVWDPQTEKYLKRTSSSPLIFFTNGKDFPRLKLRFFLEATGSPNQRRLFYKNISLSLSTPLDEFSLPKLTDSSSLNPDQLPSSLKIQGKLPWRQENLEITNLAKRIQTCGSLVPKFFDRQIKEEGNQRYLEYTSQRGAVCDFFSYPNLPQNQGYLLIVETRNLSGLPFRLCVTNHASRRCDLYTALPPARSWQEFVFALPPMNEEDSGFDININNYSIGEMLSVNDLRSIEIYPFPYRWLQTIKLQKSFQNEPQKLEISKISQPTSFNLAFQVQENPKPGLLVLSQAFEEGWQAYQLGIRNQESGIRNFLAVYFPFLFGEKIKGHVLVNNWANGWVVKPTGQEQTIVIVFWPQLLEFLGFFLGLSTILFLLITSFKFRSFSKQILPKSTLTNEFRLQSLNLPS